MKICTDCGSEHDNAYRRCRPCYNTYRRANTYSPERNRRQMLKKSFGIDVPEYDRMFSAQGGKCAICGTHQCSTGRRLAVDHDHTTGAVRGLLCANCNHGLGKFKDSPDLLEKAKDYLWQSR